MSAPNPHVIALSRQGVLLRSQGRTEEAAAAFREAAAQQPHLAQVQANLARTLFELGRHDEAKCAYSRWLEIEPESVPAHLAMYELEQIAGDNAAALRHQRQALACETLFSEIAPREQRRLLVLLAPGDWQANVPVDFLIDRQTTTLHKLYLLSTQQVQATPVPAVDAAFMAIAESEENLVALELAQQTLSRLSIPSFNAPSRVLATGRAVLANALRNVPGLLAPAVEVVCGSDVRERNFTTAFPLLIRPLGSHAGRGLKRIEQSEDLDAYLVAVEAREYYLTPFVDYRSEDGFFRKYRIIFVNGEPYPFHLAISPNWMIHYYNAPMAEHAWMREEERRFLDDLEAVFGPPLQRALRDLAGVVQLDYFGLDCSIDRQGRLLVFEADPAMIVHANDDPALYAYKRPAAQRIFTAFERLIDRARSS